MKFQIDKKDGTTRISLNGYLNETCQLDAIELEDVDQLEIDFNGVTMINSIGIAHWIRWVQGVHEKFPTATTHFHRCRSMVVDQVNNVHGFLPSNGIIHSIWVPYYNEESDQSQEILVNRGEHYHEEDGSTEKSWVKLPEENNMQPDILTQKFFRFLSRSDKQ